MSQQVRERRMPLDRRGQRVALEPHHARKSGVGVDVTVPGHGVMTVDVALVAPANPMGRERHDGGSTAGIPPGQAGVRGSGTRFCLNGPFPADPATSTPPTLLSIEQLINGVVVRFHGVEPHGPSLDLGVWENTAQRPIPLYP